MIHVWHPQQTSSFTQAVVTSTVTEPLAMIPIIRAAAALACETEAPGISFGPWATAYNINTVCGCGDGIKFWMFFNIECISVHADTDRMCNFLSISMCFHTSLISPCRQEFRLLHLKVFHSVQ